MVSRRNFFAIFLMMAVILFLFQFSQVMRESWNHYTDNEYATAERTLSDMQWSAGEGLKAGELRLSDGSRVPKERSYILFLGEPDSKTGRIVEQWCRNTKFELRFEEKLIQYRNDTLPEMILIDGANLFYGTYIRSIGRYVNSGIPIVFCSLPDVEVIRQNRTLQTILGITEIRKDEVETEGIRLFKGAFLGGEAVYKANTPKEWELQDLNLTMPWYITGAGTKTYMIGMLDEKTYEREEFPRIVWRFNGTNSHVFVVSGDYMEGDIGLGLLDMFLYELSDYSLYPVVNAQSVVMVDFPDFTDENTEDMEAIYSRDVKSVQRDIFWPGIYSMVTRNELKPTGMFLTKYDLAHEAAPDMSTMSFYLQQMNEVGAESGLSLRHSSGSSLSEKLAADEAILSGCEEASGREAYRFTAAYVDSTRDLTDPDASKSDLWKNMLTVATPEKRDYLFEYFNRDTTVQTVTQDAAQYSYSSDLKARALNTAVGYSNIRIDFHNTLWPRSADDHWENYFDEIYSNISTYWKPYGIYEQMTLSGSDLRIRRFLGLDYTSRREENRIFLSVTGGEDDCYFLLRTHDETVSDIQNAEYQKLETDAYLIHVTGEQAVITVTDSDEVLEYRGPFAK